MSMISINLNESAIDDINSAIDMYNQAIDDMKIDNSNDFAFDIIDSITKEKNHLYSLRNKIRGVNSSISAALTEKEKNKKKNKENEK